jgi:hypothetical protein
MWKRLDQVQAGMILRQAACDSLERVLLPEGAELTARLIAKLEKLNVKELDVRLAGETINGPDESGADQLRRDLARELDALFGDSEDELMLKLKEVALHHVFRYRAGLS